MSTSFNAHGAVEMTKTSEYVPFKVKYDLGNNFILYSIFILFFESQEFLC